MGREQDIHALDPKRVVVGLSAVTGITLVAGQLVSVLKYFSGGSLEIVSGQTASPWGLGYLVGTSEILNINNVATIYLVATGATATAHIIHGRSAGFSG